MIFRFSSAGLLLVTILLVAALRLEAADSPWKKSPRLIPKRHMVMMNYKGYRVSPGSHCVRVPSQWQRASKFTEVMSTSSVTLHWNDVSAAMRDFREGRLEKQKGKARLLIFIHGGLNSPRTTPCRPVLKYCEGGSGELLTEKACEKLNMESTQLLDIILKDDVFPLFINWDSGLWNSWIEHVLFVHQGHNLPGWSVLFSPLILVADLFRAVIGAPVAIKNVLSTRFVRPSWPEANLVRLGKEMSNEASGFEVFVGTNTRSDLEDAMTLYSELLFTGPNMALSPLLDAGGKGSWDMMKRRTQLLFYPDEEHYEMGRKGIDVPLTSTGGLEVFMLNLRNFFEKPEEQNQWEIVLVGHSMGGIVANRLLRRFPDLPYKDIVYMAAASSLRDYEETVLPLMLAEERTNMADNEKIEVYHLTLNRDAEIRDHFLFMRGSLLIWIDEHFEHLGSPLDRTQGRYLNIVRALRNRSEILSSRIYLKAFASSAYDPHSPRRHGDFTNPDRIRFWCKWSWRPNAGNDKGCR